MGNVTTQHAEYQATLSRWKLAEDATAGEDAVKAAKTAYLPQPNPADKTEENKQRYDQYLLRAVYYNASGRTLSSLLGLAFGRWPEIEIPAALDAAEDDISGAGVTLIQQAQETVGQVLKTGRAGLLVDFPPTDGDVSRAQQEAGGVRPTVSFRTARDVINWRTRRRAGRTEIDLVVLAESHETIDGFASKKVPQYRVLRLEAFYTVEIWREVKSEAGQMEWRIAETYTPLRGDGTVWTEIPFAFVGAQDNDWTVDSAPLYDLCVLNLAHYRNSADYEDSVFFVGQPQIWISGLDTEWRDWLQAKGVYVGSRQILPLPANGSAGILQAEPNNLAKEAMSSKEQQMAALGARLLVSGGAVKTATQQDSEDTVAHSVLSLVCDNVSAAYTKALQWYAIFARIPETGIEFSIPTDFVSRQIDPQELEALLKLVQAGKMPESDLFSRLRSAGVIDSRKTDDEIREEIAGQMPSGTGPGLMDPEEDPAAPGEDTTPDPKAGADSGAT